MKVDSQLLEKYYKGFCTNLEQDIVEKWLASSSFDDSEVLQLSENESKISHKKKMWEDISQVLAKPTIKVIPLYKKVMRYTAVACVILGMTIFSIYIIGNSQIMEQEFAFVNTDNIIKKTNINGLELGLSNKSSFKSTSTIFHKTKEISFCGNMTIKNTTKSNVKIKIHSVCNINESKEVLLQKNRNYYVFTIKEKNKEKLYVVNKGQLNRMRPHLLKKIKSIIYA